MDRSTWRGKAGATQPDIPVIADGEPPFLLNGLGHLAELLFAVDIQRFQRREQREHPAHQHDGADGVALLTQPAAQQGDVLDQIPDLFVSLSGLQLKKSASPPSSQGPAAC